MKLTKLCPLNGASPNEENINALKQEIASEENVPLVERSASRIRGLRNLLLHLEKRREQEDSLAVWMRERRKG